jgi:hypothetical protein
MHVKRRVTINVDDEEDNGDDDDDDDDDNDDDDDEGSRRSYRRSSSSAQGAGGAAAAAAAAASSSPAPTVDKCAICLSDMLCTVAQKNQHNNIKSNSGSSSKSSVQEHKQEIAEIQAPKSSMAIAMPCRHAFCYGCIKEWIRVQTIARLQQRIDNRQSLGVIDANQCPLCKRDMQSLIYAIESEHSFKDSRVSRWSWAVIQAELKRQHLHVSGSNVLQRPQRVSNRAAVSGAATAVASRLAEAAAAAASAPHIIDDDDDDDDVDDDDGDASDSGDDSDVVLVSAKSSSSSTIECMYDRAQANPSLLYPLAVELPDYGLSSAQKSTVPQRTWATEVKRLRPWLAAEIATIMGSSSNGSDSDVDDDDVEDTSLTVEVCAAVFEGMPAGGNVPLPSAARASLLSRNKTNELTQLAQRLAPYVASECAPTLLMRFICESFVTRRSTLTYRHESMARAQQRTSGRKRKQQSSSSSSSDDDDDMIVQETQPRQQQQQQQSKRLKTAAVIIL